MVSHKYEESKTKNYNNTIKDTPSLCDNNALLKKQKVDVCKPRVLSPISVLKSPSLWFSPFFNSSWRISSNSYEKTSTQDFLPCLFCGVTLAGIESIVLAARNP
jgi:hypothetical protein